MVIVCLRISSTKQQHHFIRQPICDNWAFNVPRGAMLLDKWNQIPRGIDILLTHTPPLGHGDKGENGLHVGDVELLNSICKRIRPAYHVFAKEESCEKLLISSLHIPLTIFSLRQHIGRLHKVHQLRAVSIELETRSTRSSDL